jgi:hypothetical protein
MAFGNLLDYEPLPAAPGAPPAYNFLTKDGRKVTAFGAEAEAVRRKLDEAKAMGPQPTAQIRRDDLVIPEGGFGGFGGAVQNPTALDVGPAPTPGAAAPVAAVGPAGPPAAPPTVPASIARPPEPTAPAGPQMVAPGHRVNPQTGLIEAYRGGAGGSKGGWRDTSQSVRGAYPVNEQFVAEQAAAHGQEQDALRLQHEGEQKLADAEASHNFKLALHYDDAQREAQNRADYIQGRVRELDSNFERLNKEYTSARVDPRRMFAGGKNWLYGLFAGMGTLGAGLAKTPNYTLQIIEQRIADDIEAQKAEVAVKRDSADNAYKRLLQETGSSELATKALQGIQLSKLRSELEVASKDGRDKVKQAQAQALFAASDRKWSEWQESYHRAALGDVTKNMVYVPASAGRPAGWYPVSDQLATAGKIQNLQQGEVQIQKTAADAAKTAGEAARGPEPPKKSADQAKYENTLEATSRTLQDFVEAHGGTYNPETGEITGELEMPVDLPGGDTGDTAGVKSTLGALGNVYANMLNAGAEAGQPFKDKVTPQPGTFSNAATVAQLKAMGRETAMRRQQVRSQAPAQVQAPTQEPTQ